MLFKILLRYRTENNPILKCRNISQPFCCKKKKRNSTWIENCKRALKIFISTQVIQYYNALLFFNKNIANILLQEA